MLHGDLTINNILLDEHLDPWFIDLERARLSAKAVGWQRAAEDFFRLSRHVEKLGPSAQRAALRLTVRYCTVRGWAHRSREFAAAVRARLRRKLKTEPGVIV